MKFTTRPELVGVFGMAASTHWIASAVGMKMLEAGGTAADAAAAMGFVLNVVEPHLNGPLGDLPLLVASPGAAAPQVICGQGPAPAAASIERMKADGIDAIPGSGLVAAVTPGAFDAWMLLLRDHGRLSLAEVMAPAIHYAEAGHPALPRLSNTIDGLAAFFAEEWPSSAAVWTPGGQGPAPGALFRNPDLAAFWRRLVSEAEAAGGREAQIEAARRAFYEGFVAEAIERQTRTTEAMDGAGVRRKGLLTAEDMAGWRARYEDAVAADHHGWTIWKPGPWSQGPSLLQALRIVENDDLTAMEANGADFVHLTTEALKRAQADREAYYGDPDHADIPLKRLLSAEHAAAHRAAIGREATRAVTPGAIEGCEAWAAAAVAQAERSAANAGVGGGEPTMAHLGQRGDTVHIDVVDQWGGMVSATPSGGWLQSNPVVPGLGVPLGTRAQMFWLEPGRPSSLIPGARPRTTLSPSMARSPDGEMFAFGTPGGDQQDQWQFAFLLRLIHHGMNLQEAIDAPLFHTNHVTASFHPRGRQPAHLMVEPGIGPMAQARLRAMGHEVEVAAPWTVGRLTAVGRRPDGLMRAAATPRLMQAYAVGR